MKAELFPFQKIALHQLRMKAAAALGFYQQTRTPQVISFTAPTGAGKTIILSALIENIYCGDEEYPEQPEAIFVWLSDSPELNQQSRDKIDLKADRLIGTIIVGTGLPGVGNERELLKFYFDEKLGQGFDYAYLFPGMNKVLQAGGRVIRSEQDKGVIALLDERFNYSSYRRLFPREWIPFEKLDKDSVEDAVEKFWTEQINNL